MKTMVCDVIYRLGQDEFDYLTVVLMKDGDEVGKAVGCKIKAQRKVLELERFGAISAAARVEEEPQFCLELERLVINEKKLKIYELDGFDVMLKSTSSCEIFYGCSWVDFEGDYICGGGDWSKMTVVSSKRRRVFEEENG
jgi:hypothetical protein